jgi:hypothetical protein
MVTAMRLTRNPGTRIWLLAVLSVLLLTGGASAQTPGPSVGCQLPDVAFCDSFTSGPAQGSKSGDLNPAQWHITRVNPAYQFAGN